MTFDCDSCGHEMDLKQETVLVGQITTVFPTVGETWRFVVVCAGCDQEWTLECDDSTGWKLRNAVRWRFHTDRAVQRRYNFEFDRIVSTLNVEGDDCE